MTQLLYKTLLPFLIISTHSLVGNSDNLDAPTEEKDWTTNNVSYSLFNHQGEHHLKKFYKTHKTTLPMEMLATTPKAKKAFSGTFTLEFDFFINKLPLDLCYGNLTPKSIEIFQALNQADKKIMSLKINQYNRLTLFLSNSSDKKFKLLSTWNVKENHTVASILRGKWYQVSIVRTMPQNNITVYLDGALVGSSPFSGNFDMIKTLRLGNCFAGNSSSTFYGGITKAKLSKQALHNANSSKLALTKARIKMNLAAKKINSTFLLPEKPSWSSNHPRLLLTPSRIQVLKANLEKGHGPKLLARLLAECSDMIDPTSPDYLDELKFRSSIPVVTKPALLCLATQLTGQKKYAEHAAKIVTSFVSEYGYHDHAHQLVQSVLMSKPMLGVALTYDWGYDYLTTKQKRQIRLFLFETAKATYDYYKGNVSNSSAKRDAMRGWVANWTALSISTLGNACLAILGETSGPVLSWLDYASFRSAQYGLFAIGSNGCFHEMPGYMAYGAGPLLLFMDALNTAGGDNLLKATNFSTFPDFLAYLIFPTGPQMMPLKYSSKTNSFHRGDSYILAMMKKRLKTKSAEWCWQKIYGNNPWATCPLFNILWFEPEKECLKTPALPLAKWFKSEGFAAFRSSWKDKNAIAGTLMAYPAKIMAHDQSDRGQFTLYGFQGRWIIDSGGRATPEAAYRSAHNLITIDNQKTIFKPVVMNNHHHDSFLTGFCHLNEAGTVIEADLTASYRYIYNWQHRPVSSSGKVNKKDDFKTAIRKLLFVREKSAPAYILVYDRIQKDDIPHTYTLNLHTAAENEVTIKKDRVNFYKYPQNIRELSSVYRPLNKDGSRQYYYSGDPQAGYAEYIINIPQDGTYDLYGFGHSGSKNPGGMDSFIVEIAGTKMNWGVPAYQWNRINKQPLTLKKGPNILTLLLREPETRAAKLAIFPHANNQIPLFNKPDQKDLIIIDAGKPSTIKPGFQLTKETFSSTVPEASMTLFPLSPEGEIKKDVFPGTPLNHYRLTISTKTKAARFLNLFYPHKKGMEIPVTARLAENVFSVKWTNCNDIICYNNGSKETQKDFQTDADLIFIRMKESEIISFALVNGTYLTYKKQSLIKLIGGKGTALWSHNSLAISGKNVYNFDFNHPVKNGILSTVKAQGKTISAKRTGDIWHASMSFTGENVLTW